MQGEGKTNNRSIEFLLKLVDCVCKLVSRDYVPPTFCFLLYSSRRQNAFFFRLSVKLFYAKNNFMMNKHIDNYFAPKNYFAPGK